MRDTDDEDYEISNQVLNNYLIQLSEDHLQPDRQLTDSSPYIDVNNSSELKISHNKAAEKSIVNLTNLLLDPNQITLFLDSTNVVLSELDKNFLLNMHMVLLSKLTNKNAATSSFSKLIIVKALFLSNSSICFLLFLLLITGFMGYVRNLQEIIISLSIIIILIFFFVIIFICVFKFEIINWLFLRPTIASAEAYLKDIRHLVYYLKEIEMVIWCFVLVNSED